VRKIQSLEQNFAIYCENGRTCYVLPEQIHNKTNISKSLIEARNIHFHQNVD